MFDDRIGIGAIIEIVLTFGGLVGGWFTLKAVVGAAVEKLGALQGKFDEEVARNSRQHDENRDRASTLELQMTREYVSKEEFRRFDDKLQTRFERVEAAVNNSANKTIESVKDAVREMLNHRGRE